METWVIITVAAAFLQNVRSAMQKHLKGVMGTTGATFVRFGFGLPFALLYLIVLWRVAGHPLPVPNGTFFLWAVIGGLAQIAATFLLVHLFSFRNLRLAPPIRAPSRPRQRSSASSSWASGRARARWWRSPSPSSASC